MYFNQKDDIKKKENGRMNGHFPVFHCRNEKCQWTQIRLIRRGSDTDAKENV